MFLGVIFRKKLKLNISDFKKMMPVALAFFLAYAVQTVGSKYTTASKSAFYTALNVLFVPYVSWILNRKAPDIFTYISSLMCVIGVGIISYVPGENMFTFNIGDALVILSAIFFGVHIAINGHYSKIYSIEKSIMIQSITGTVLFWICTIFTHIVSKNEVVIRSLSRSEMLSILYLGLISTGLCLLMQTSFQRYTQATRASIFLASESLFSPIFAAIVLKEQLTVNIFIGAGLIIVAVLLSETKDLISLIFGKKKGIKK